MPEVGKTDDLATLSNLDEAILLEELQRRYAQDRVYVSQYRTSHNIESIH